MPSFYAAISLNLTFNDLQYVFLTMEAMVDAAVHMGFPRDMATRLVITTIRVHKNIAANCAPLLKFLITFFTREVPHLRYNPMKLWQSYEIMYIVLDDAHF